MVVAGSISSAARMMGACSVVVVVAKVVVVVVGAGVEDLNRGRFTLCAFGGTGLEIISYGSGREEVDEVGTFSII